MRVGYAVVDVSGQVYRNRQGRLCIFTTVGPAKRLASDDGDSVVEVHVDLNREPLFIRAKKLDGDS